MDLKQIKDLMAAMEDSGIKKLSLKEKTGFELQIEREGDHPPHVHSIPQPSQPAMFFSHPMEKMSDFPSAHSPATGEKKESEEKQQKGVYITSPMVGTFYSAASPDDPVFMKVGDKVTEDSLVCIVEAMKVMNEVKAGVKGIVAEVCLENGHPVEFGTKLFRIV